MGSECLDRHGKLSALASGGDWGFMLTNHWTSFISDSNFSYFLSYTSNVH